MSFTRLQEHRPYPVPCARKQIDGQYMHEDLVSAAIDYRLVYDPSLGEVEDDYHESRLIHRRRRNSGKSSSSSSSRMSYTTSSSQHDSQQFRYGERSVSGLFHCQVCQPNHVWSSGAISTELWWSALPTRHHHYRRSNDSERDRYRGRGRGQDYYDSDDDCHSRHRSTDSDIEMMVVDTSKSRTEVETVTDTGTRGYYYKYRILIHAQKCQFCENFVEPEVNLANFVERMIKTFDLWTGRRDPLPFRRPVEIDSRRGILPHDERRCHGCEIGVCGIGEQQRQRRRRLEARASHGQRGSRRYSDY
ncbi:hypothetical protein BGZ83_011589 [Gryganskiella cystojenkinii]|nr:hypothetical protein BGZ83_011589 [Gryganskiella cystojenkinii]